MVASVVPALRNPMTTDTRYSRKQGHANMSVTWVVSRLAAPASTEGAYSPRKTSRSAIRVPRAAAVHEPTGRKLALPKAVHDHRPDMLSAQGTNPIARISSQASNEIRCQCQGFCAETSRGHISTGTGTGTDTVCYLFNMVYYLLLHFTTCYYLLLLLNKCLFYNFVEKVRDSWRKLEKVREWLEKVWERLRKLEKVGERWRKL